MFFFLTLYSYKKLAQYNHNGWLGVKHQVTDSYKNLKVEAPPVDNDSSETALWPFFELQRLGGFQPCCFHDPNA